MKQDSDDGLFISFDKESNTFDLEWDDAIHPEYNFLRLLEPEQLNRILSERLQELIDDETGSDI